MRIQLLNEKGEKLKLADGRPMMIFSVDGKNRVKSGELVEVREVQQIGDQKKNVLVAYRPKTEADKKKVLSDKKAAMEKLQAEIDAEEKAPTKTVAKKPAVKLEVPAEPAESEAEDAFEAEINSEEEEPVKAPKKKRTRPTRTPAK